MALTRKTTAEKGAAAWLRDCADRITVARAQTLTSDDTEGPHQLRVGLRRLRTVLRAASPAIGGPAARDIADEAKWLGREVGRARDLDVLGDELVEPMLADDARADPAATVLALLDEARAEEWARLRVVLEDERCVTFVAALDAFIARRGWLDPGDLDQTERLAQPVGKLADAALARRWKSCRKAAKGIGPGDAARRHELRKDLKKLRYTLEYCAPLYPQKTAATFLKRLKRLQTVLGDLNDAEMARRVLTDPALREGLDPAAAGDLDRVAGWIAADAEAGRAQVDALWAALAATSPPWNRA